MRGGRWSESNTREMDERGRLLVRAFERQDSVGRGRIAHEAADIGREVTLFIHGVSEPAAVRFFLVSREPCECPLQSGTIGRLADLLKDKCNYSRRISVALRL